MEGKSMLCQVFASSCQNGEMILPPELCSKFPNEIPETVYLGVRNGEAWRAYYRERSACIVKLEAMMSFYKIKPYDVVLLRYKGDGNFNMEIFNDTVEIDYPLRIFGTKKPRLDVPRGSTTRASSGAFSEFELEKMAARFFYKASGNSRMSYDLTIQSEHLQISNLSEVLSEEGICKLRLHSDMRWIEFGLEKSTWDIKLIWKNGHLFFNEDWIKFTKALNLREGDICVISRTMHFQKFKIAILENSEVNNVNEEVKGNSRFYLKSFKILTNDMLATGDLELPREFTKAYGGNLRKKVNLFMADGSKYHAHFCQLNNLLFGLKELFGKYGLGEGFFVFFDYVGPANLYLSVYNKSCVDIFNFYTLKFLLKDMRKDYMCLGNDVSASTEESSDDSSESSSADIQEFEMTITSHETLSVSVVSVHSSLDISLSSDGYNSVPNDSTEENSEANPLIEDEIIGDINSFIVTLMPSHVDQRGHGVYFARHMLSIYRPWSNGTEVILVYGEKWWAVAVHRKKKMCRFGLHWDDFTKDNDFYTGQKLRFLYEGDRTFRVSVVP